MVKEVEQFLEKVRQRGWAWPFGLGTLVVMTAVYAGFYAWLMRILPVWLIARAPSILVLHPAVLMSNVVIHELGHWTMFRRAGFRPTICFLILGGVTYVSDESWAQKQSALTIHQFLGIFAGGIIGNILLVALAWPWLSHPIWHHYAQAVCALNGGIIVSNILPFPGSDGARFLKKLYGDSQIGFDFGRRLWAGGYVAVFLIAIMAVTKWPIL